VLRKEKKTWQEIAEGTSEHLTLLSFDIDEKDDHVFLTLTVDTDEAMGMNMVTIAAQAAGNWIAKELLPKGARFVTVAGNVDSDKKPSLRTKQKGRGYDVSAQAVLDAQTIKDVLHSSPEAMANVAKAKLRAGSSVAMALGRNLHVANIVAALYLATGQDAAHVVEASMADTIVTVDGTSLTIATRIPAVIVGIRGGGIDLPSQNQCLKMLLKPATTLHPKAQLAESIGAAVLAGEVSLLASQASHTLASAHKKLGR
jgi:hydroxymethylglutaryl-CoA reductase (NADPH)